MAYVTLHDADDSDDEYPRTRNSGLLKGFAVGTLSTVGTLLVADKARRMLKKRRKRAKLRRTLQEKGWSHNPDDLSKQLPTFAEVSAWRKPTAAKEATDGTSVV